MTTSLLISTYNRPDFLRAVLATVKNQTVFPAQIIIADDGSTDETKAVIDQFRPMLSPASVDHIWHEDKGFRKTIILNKAIQACTSDYIIQIDGDILLHPRFIEDHLSEARKGYFVRGSRALILEEYTQEIVQTSKTFSSKEILKGVKRVINGIRIPFLSYLYSREFKDVRNVKGCNFAFWKSDMEKINGYNNDLTGWGHEDIEVAARLYNSGVRIRRLKFKAVCYHLHHSLNSRQQEGSNLSVYEYVISNKISTCLNGLKQMK